MKKEYSIQCKKCGEIIKIAYITPDDKFKFNIDGEKANLIVDEYGNIPIHNDTDEILNEVLEELENEEKNIIINVSKYPYVKTLRDKKTINIIIGNHEDNDNWNIRVKQPCKYEDVTKEEGIE